MFNYRRSRNRVAAVFLISLAVFLPALVLPRSGDDLTVRKLILTSSLGVALISGVVLLVRWDETKRLTRLRSGIGILAQWTIDRARWEWFRGQSSIWDTQQGIRPNDANLTQDPTDAGIHIVVTRDGLLIGEEFWPLERNVRFTVRADWMEFFQVIHKVKGPPLHIVLRVPIPIGKESLGAEVQQSYQHAWSAAGPGGVNKVQLALAIFVGLPLVTALSWLVAKVTGWVE